MHHQPHDAATEQRIAQLTATVKDRSERRRRLTRWAVVAILAGIFAPASPAVFVLTGTVGPWMGPVLVGAGLLGLALLATGFVLMARGILARMAAERANNEIIQIDPSRSLVNTMSSRARRAVRETFEAGRQ